MDIILSIGHWLGGLGVLLSNGAVWVGVYLEGEDKPKETQARGWSLLLRGLAAEAAFGFMLFAADAEISIRQQSTIAALEGETRIARTEAATASRKTADLLVENTELERAIAICAGV